MNKIQKLVVDVHTHVYLPRYMNYLRSRRDVPRVFGNPERLVILPGEDQGSTKTGRPVGPEYYDPLQKLKFMDDHAIDFSVVSLANPWLEFIPESTANQLSKDLNDDLHQWCVDYPRLYGMAVLPTLSVKGSIHELDHISSLSKIKGVIMGTHGLGKGLDDPCLEPVFKKIQDLDLVIFLHPHYGIPKETFGSQDNGHVLPLALGFPFETTIAISRLILTGIFDRLPKLKILLAHSGGTIPFLAGRLDSCVLHDSSPVGSRLNKLPSEYLKNLYFDAVSYHAPALNCVKELVGTERIIFGTDHPFFPPVNNDTCSTWESVDMNKRAIEHAFKEDAWKETNVSIYQSIAAGAIAGAIEATITYPTEYIKTQLQLQKKDNLRFKGPIDCLVKTVKEKGIKGLYRGLSALVAGTASKAAIRFLAFEEYKKLLSENNVLTPSKRMLAGLAAGVTEAILVVTPTETIKTKLIHDINLPNPKYNGLIHGTRMIIRQEGISGIYRGVSAVILRQGANSAVRLTCYDLLKQYCLNNFYKGTSVLPWYTSFALGSIAGTITVYTTMPLDVLKTQMQGLNAKTLYKNSLDCLIKIVRNDGILSLWKGATPRLGRLIFSGGIVFTIYDQIISLFKLLP